MGGEGWQFENQDIFSGGLVQDHATGLDPGITARAEFGTFLGNLTDERDNQFLAGLSNEREGRGVVLWSAWPRFGFGIEVGTEVNSSQGFWIVHEKCGEIVVTARSDAVFER